MKLTNKYLILIILLTLLGCKNSKSKSFESSAEKVVASKTEEKKPEISERKLIKIGKLEFETNNLNSTRKTIFEAVNKHKGYVSSDQEFKSAGRKSNTIIIRVPAANFDNLLMDATQGVNKFDTKEIDVEDITEEFLDVQARLKTKKELEQRYIALLKKANKVTEILEIEKQIGQLRSEVESIEGRLKYLQNKVSLSTLTMTFYESIPNETEFARKFKDGFRNGWENFIWFFVGLINVWPFILIGLGLVIGVKIYKNKK